MEENFNTEELNNEEGSNTEEPALSKEEVLARSRKENSSGDEREQGRRLWSRSLGFAACVIACGVAIIVRACMGDLAYDLPAVIFTGVAAQNAAEAFYTANKKLKWLAIFVAVLSVGVATLYWVQFGLQLAGK